MGLSTAMQINLAGMSGVNQHEAPRTGGYHTHDAQR
jgi:hypothetical protein